MEIRWVPYNGFLESIEEDLEAIMLISEPSSGISIGDIYRYASDINFVYCKLCSEKTGRILHDLVREGYNRNDEFFGNTLRTIFSTRSYITLNETSGILKNFLVPVAQ